MKRLFLIVLVLLLLLTGAWLAPRLLDDPGYVMIDIGRWRLEASVLVLVGAVLLGWLLLSLIFAVFRMPRRTSELWRRHQLENGLLAMAEGDWRRAEKALTRASSGSRSTAGYLAAARAAQGQARLGHRDRYLEQAQPRFGRRRFITEMARARMLIEEGDLEQALGLLEPLHLKKTRHAGVLRLLLHVYQELGRWRDVRLLAPALRRAGVVDRERARSLVVLASGRELEDASDLGALETTWSELSRATRRDAEVVRAFADRAVALGQPGLPEPELRRALGSELHAELLRAYAAADEADLPHRVDQVERWRERHPENAALLLTLGELYERARRFDDARDCLEKSIQLQPTSRGYEILARVLDRQGRLELATQCYRNALRLSHGRPVERLPALE